MRQDSVKKLAKCLTFRKHSIHVSNYDYFTSKEKSWSTVRRQNLDIQKSNQLVKENYIRQ